MASRNDEGTEFSAGVPVQAALTRVLRWSGRRGNRRVLFGAMADDLSQNDIWLLDAVEDSGPVRLSDLASWQGVDKSTITPQVRRLESLGLLERQTSPEDRRSVVVALTASGRSVQRHRVAAGAALIDQLLGGWPESDVGGSPSPSPGSPTAWSSNQPSHLHHAEGVLGEHVVGGSGSRVMTVLDEHIRNIGPLRRRSAEVPHDALTDPLSPSTAWRPETTGGRSNSRTVGTRPSPSAVRFHS